MNSETSWLHESRRRTLRAMGPVTTNGFCRVREPRSEEAVSDARELDARTAEYASGERDDFDEHHHEH